MVAIPTDKHDERRSRKSHKMEAYVVVVGGGEGEGGGWHGRRNVWDKMATCWWEGGGRKGRKMG